MWPSVLVLVFACAVFTAEAVRFQSVDWNSFPAQQSNDKRDSTADADPETIRLLMALYQKMQNDYEYQNELKRKPWSAPAVSHTNPDTLNQQEVAALTAGGAVEKKADRNTRNYKNCFLSPVQCVMKGRA